jgi:hypothetical protein
MAMQEKIEVDAIELKTIEMRINGVKDATYRSRFIFIIMTIAASAIFICQWNLILSWERGVAFEKDNPDTVIAGNQKTARDEWIKNMTISVGLLGIRISTTDLSIIGSASLTIIMVWFFFSQRRENRAIVGLLRHCNKGFVDKRLSKDICSLAYEGIVQSIIFIDMGGGDKPISGIVSNDDNAQSTFFIRTILKGLIYLPPVTILITIISDIYSLFIPSHLRGVGIELWRILFNGEHNWSIVKIAVFDIFALLCCIYTWFLCRNIREFSKANAKTIKDFKAKLLPEIYRLK